MKNSKDDFRFRDEQFRITDFRDHVWVICPVCKKCAVADANHRDKEVRLICNSCGYCKSVSTAYGKGHLIIEANGYFNAKLWFEIPFKDHTLWAYNPEHLNYLEKYIAAGLRENKNREHSTMLEKLPKFMQIAKNRDPLLRLIAKLRQKK